ncbi:MAG: hypothetical protein M1828_006885 [Chrysothrix sp. TS-e1954]|nr:MAG: hypothetical protein M1828_006885 [Chrysothrix sp. TS-e1954]
MLDGALDYVSRSVIAYSVLGFSLFLWIFSYINEERKIRRLGGRAPQRKPWAPMGLAMVYDGVTSALRDDNLKFWHNNFMKDGNPNNPYTLEANAGGERIVFTADPENIKAVLATQFNDFGKGEVFNREWHDFLGDGIFSTDGKKWQHSRQLIRPQFVKDRVSDLETFERTVSELIPLLDCNGQAVDVKDLFLKYTLDAATDFLLGRNVQSLTKPNAFAEAFAHVQHTQSLVARTGPLNWAVPRRAFHRHMRTINSFVESFIDEALALSPAELEKRTSSVNGYTFLHAIASYTRDRSVLRDQIVNVLLAGRDTTALTLSFLFHELARNPDVVAKLRSEIQQTCGMHAQPTYANLKSMRYLQHNLSEVLRMYPVVPFNVRVALKDTTLPHGSGPDGNSPVGVLKGTPIGYSTQYMQLRNDIYPPTSEKFPAPHLFRPERWEHWQPKIWTYLPFNGGPRICVGQQFALTEMGYTVVRLLQRFSRLESRGGSAEAPFGLTSGASEDRGLGDGFQARGDAQSIDQKYKWRRGGATGTSDASVVERVGGVENGMKMKSEVVLSPSQAVKIAFYA